MYLSRGGGLEINCQFHQQYIATKLSKYGVLSGPYFPVFGLNKEIYSINLRIQSGYREIRSRKSSAFQAVIKTQKRHYNLLTLNRFHTFFWCFYYYWLWTSKFWLGSCNYPQLFFRHFEKNNNSQENLHSRIYFIKVKNLQSTSSLQKII